MHIIEITSEEARRLLREDGVILVDVRSPVEFDLYRVEDEKVINIPLDELDLRKDELMKYKKILCICRTNRRSREAALLLVKLGFDTVYVVRDGVVGWLGMALNERPSAEG